jgi:membrane-associated protease RseP (regulator of RpoE activity)
LLIYLLVNLSVKSLSGPVGIYSIVGSEARQDLVILYALIAFLSINIGFIKFITIPHLLMGEEHYS